MLDKIKQIISEIGSFTATTPAEVEQFRIKHLSKKGTIAALFDDFKNVPADQKKEIGKALNELKTAALDKVNELKEKLCNSDQGKTGVDLTLPGDLIKLGSRHPLSIVKNEILAIFNKLGFTISEGPEIEDDWHNFSALNFPEEHPARDMQDTFFIEKNPDIVLHTHTSSVQVRDMETHSLPIRLVTPGRVFRNEAISARAHCIFHQIEALYTMKMFLLRFKTDADLFCQRTFRSGNPNPAETVLLPIYRTFGRNGCFLFVVSWRRM